MDRDLCWTTARTWFSLIRRRKVSPLEVMQAVLARIDKVNRRSTLLHVAAEQALAAAKKATAEVGKKSATLGPLHGVPVSIKDLAPTKGIRTRGARRSSSTMCRTKTRWSSSG